MDETYKQIFDADATGLINVANDVAAAMSKMNEGVAKAGAAIEALGAPVDGTTLRFTGLTESGEKLTKTLVAIDGAFQESAITVGFANQQLGQQSEKLKQASIEMWANIEAGRAKAQTDEDLKTKAMEYNKAIANEINQLKVLDAEDAVRLKFEKDFAEANERRVENELQYTKDLIDHISKLNEKEALRLLSLHQQQIEERKAFDAEFADANAKQDKRDQEIAQIEHENEVIEQQVLLYKKLEAAHLAQLKAEATTFGNKLLSDLSGSSKAVQGGLGEASPAQLQRTLSIVAQIQGLIEKGTISAQRMSEIATAVALKTGEVFTGVERQGANYVAALHNNLTKLGDDFEGIGKSSEKVTISWESMVRILQVQLFHQALYALINDLKMAVSEAAEFEIRISEIRTISQANQLSTEQWSRSLENLSNAFGTPILDVVEGEYQVLSNQIAQGAESFNFLTTAMHFGQVTMASTKDSVNLLSSAINSFHLETSDADRVASVLFNTITQGRLRADELSNIFGRVGSISHALGLSIEETGAAISTLTVNGIPANEAMTLLNNVLTHLLNPTSEMKDLFKELGVTSGETMIATYGFAGTLAELQKRTQGSSGEMAELFKDIRGIRGALDFSNEGLVTFNKNLAAIRDTKKFDLASIISVESAGKQFEIQLNEIKNYFMHDFGVGVLDTLEAITDSTGGLVKDTEKLAEAALAASVAWGLYKLAAIAAKLATVELNAAMLLNPWFLIPAAIAIAIYSIEDYVNESKKEQAELDNLYENAARQSSNLTKYENDLVREQLQIKLDAIDTEEHAVFKSFSNIARKLTEQNILIEDAYKVTAENVKIIFKDLEESMSKNINDLNHAAEIAKTVAETASARLQESRDSLSKKQFDTQISGLPKDQQLDARMKQIQQLSDLSAKLLTTGQDSSDPNASEKMKIDQTEGLKREAEAEQILSNLAAEVSEAERRRNELNREIAHTKEQLAALGLNQAAKEQIQALEKLEQEAKLAHTKRDTLAEKQLEIQIEDQRAALAKNHNLEEAKAITERLNNLELQKSKDDAILTAAAKYNDLVKISNDLQEKHNQALQQEFDLAEKLEKSKKKQAEEEQSELNRMKIVIQNIEAAKTQTKKIDTSGGVDKYVKEHFTDQIESVDWSKNLTLYKELLEEKAEFERKLNLQVAQDKLKKDEEAVKQAFDAKKKAISDEAKLVQDANEKNNTNMQALQNLIGKGSEQGSNGRFMPRNTPLEKKFDPLGLDDNAKLLQLEDLLSNQVATGQSTTKTLAEFSKLLSPNEDGQTRGIDTALLNQVILAVKTAEQSKSNLAKQQGILKTDEDQIKVDQDLLKSSGIQIETQKSNTDALKDATKTIQDLINAQESLKLLINNHNEGVQSLNYTPQYPVIPGFGSTGSTIQGGSPTTNDNRIALNIYANSVDIEAINNAIRQGRGQIRSNDGIFG